jgi:hypothetical protein
MQYWNSPVERLHIDALTTAIQDVGASRGVLFSTKGFQSGAIESGEFVIPGFAKISVVNKPATEARSGVNPFTKEPMEFAAKPASKSVRASPLKVAKDAV